MMKLLRPEWLGLSVLLVGCFLRGYGQEQTPITPPSPEAAAMMRSINIPVSHYTGTANINVPLYTIRTRDMEIPIQLDYHASGIKVQDFATWVGLGWRLSVPASITRTAKRGYDEGGFMAGDGDLVRNGEWNEALFDQKINVCDGEADLFYFEIPGKSGTMVWSPKKKQFYTVPYQNLKIDYFSSYNTFFAKFCITDENGNRYIFTPSEHVTLDAFHSVPTAWSISQILTAQGDWIEFDYLEGYDLKYGYMTYGGTQTYEVQKSPFSRTLKDDDDRTESNHGTSVSPKYLSCIRWRSGKMEFISDDNRAWTDVRTRRLTEIKLYAQTDRYIKSFLFSYNTFFNTALQLWKIEEANRETGKRELFCSFGYNTKQNLPLRNSLDMDHWGYYNGPNSSNGSLFPAHTVLGHAISGADRTPHWPYASANMLTSVTYKGGGKKEFEYEPNQLTSGEIIGGVRIKEVREYASATAPVSVTRYEYLEGEAYDTDIYYTSVDTESPYLANTFTYRINSMSFNALFDQNGSPIVYPLVKETLPDGSYTLYRYSSFAQYPDSLPDIYTPYAAGMMHEPPSYSSRTYLPRTSYAWQRGLLLEQSLYSADGTLQMRQRNRYDMNAPAKAEILCATMENSQYPIFGTPTKRMATYKWISQPIYLDSVIVEQSAYSLPSVTTYVYDTTYLHIKESIVKDAANDIYKTTFKYPCDYDISSSSDNMYSALKTMQDNHMDAFPLEVLSYKNGRITGGHLTTYKEASISSSKIILKQSDLSLKLARPLADADFVHSNHSDGLNADSRYDTLAVNLKFDGGSNPIYINDRTGGQLSYIYGYNKSLPIAVVQNAMTYESPNDYKPSIRKEIFHTSFEEDTSSNVEILPLAKTGRKAYRGSYQIAFNPSSSTDSFILSYWISRDEGRTWTKVDAVRKPWTGMTIGEENAYVDEVRVYPQDARMTTYTYLPGIGMTSQTDPNGHTVYYEYDALGRLSAIRDNERRLLKSYQYE